MEGTQKEVMCQRVINDVAVWQNLKQQSEDYSRFFRNQQSQEELKNLLALLKISSNILNSYR